MIQCKRNSSFIAVSRIFRTLYQSATLSTPPHSDVSDDTNNNNNKWNNNISHYIIEDKNLLRPSFISNSSLHVLDLIDNGSLQPDRTIYNNLLKRCTMLGKLKQGKIVHTHILNSQFKNDLVIQNSILFMYAKCGSLEIARQVFDEMRVKDRVTWTSMITGYSQNECASSALVLFPEMIRDGARPNEFTLSSLVKCCGFLGSYVDGKQIHGCCWKYGLQSNVFVGNSLVDMYARSGYLREAQLVFDELESKNEVSWNALISGYARKGDGEEALALFVKMQREDYGATDFTYSALLCSSSSTGSLEQGKWLHAHMMKSGWKLVGYVGNTLLHMYAKSGNISDAKKVFDRLVKVDVVSCNSMLIGYAQHGFGKEAVDLFEEMILWDEIKPNDITFLSVITACSHAGLLDDGKYYFELMKKYGLKPKVSHYTTVVDLLGRAGLLDQAKRSNVFVGNSLVDMYARSGYLREAQLVFDELESKNEVSWNALISGYARKGDGEEALALFVKMQREDYGATDFTYSALLCSSSSTGSLEQGKWLHAHMMKSGWKLVGYVGNTLLHMYAKSGNISDAKKVFDRLVKVDVVSCNSMLIGYAQHGFGKEAVDLFEEMILWDEIKPNDITFLSVLTACSHAGLLDDGKYYFELMKKYGLKPKVSHYTTVVDLLGRAGLLDQAKSFIEEMPIEPTATIWGALLGASKMHKNTEMGAYAAQKVLELDPFYSGTHTLLSNIYASAGKWKDVAKVRKMMKDSGLKKEPACSWVEIENSVHVFVANDFSHPQKDKVYEMWENLNQKIKEIGYVPDTSHVHLYVDQQEKELNLQYHSEKLALAFALLNTSPGSTIRIMKNIRVCGDCHSAIKYVSLVVKREIIVRDTNRFHHFRDGSCSCRDYW